MSLWALLLLLLVATALAVVARWRVRARRKLAAEPPARRKKRRRAAPPRTVPRHPVVLAHGLFGFDELKVGRTRVEYWKGIPRALRKMGVEVAVPRFGTVASVERRAAELAAFIRKSPAPKVNVIAHSMGGVDARVAIARLGLADRIASLVTVGTPHRGTPLADLGSFALTPFAGKAAPRDLTSTDVAKSGRAARSPKRRSVRDADGGRRKPLLDVGGIRDARPSAMRRLNRRVPDDAGVHYASVVSAVNGVGRMNPLLVPGYLFLSGKAGPNDGVVPAESQAWGDVLATVEADHWAVVGWSKGFDAPAFYAQILRELAGRGF